METSAVPPNSVNLRADDDALVSKVMEIIGSITPEPFNTMVEPEDKDVWSLEEGDDSVFYSDEEQAKCPHPTDSGTAGEPHQQKEGNPEEKEGIKEENSETEQEAPPQVTEGEHQNLQTAKAEQMSTSDPGQLESELTPGASDRSCEEFLQSNEEKKQTEQKTSAGKVNHVEMEEVVPEAPTANLKLFEEFNERSFTSLNEEAELPKQPPGSPNLQIQVDRTAAQDLSFHVHGGFHHNLSAGYSSTLPVMKKPACYQKAFNHLTSSKYSTVSYRRIRRGNTQQKVEEFEHLMMNR
ncbi:ermin [Parambassis ranga]|uniref:Ermin n=1 Tax=Parambassis ranga TaxID=210632 RepID=A0A6P7H2P2_9TELE|nr:ermin-like [Parambassis ranga]